MNIWMKYFEIFIFTKLLDARKGKGELLRAKEVLLRAKRVSVWAKQIWVSQPQIQGMGSERIDPLGKFRCSLLLLKHCSKL